GFGAVMGAAPTKARRHARALTHAPRGLVGFRLGVRPRLSYRYAICLCLLGLLPAVASAAPNAGAPVRGVDVTQSSRGQLSPARLRDLKAEGVNTLLLDVAALGSATGAVNRVEQIRSAAAGAHLGFVALVPAVGKASPAVWHAVNA